MPHHKSAIKRLKTNEKSRERNKAARSEIRTSIKKLRGAANADDAAKEIPHLFSLIDKAARKNQAGFTPNRAANYKSKAHKTVARLKAAAQPTS